MPYYKLWLQLQACQPEVETGDEPVYTTIELVDIGTFASLADAQARVQDLVTSRK